MRLSALAFLAGTILLQSCARLPDPSWAWWALICLPVLRLPGWRIPAMAVLGFSWALLRADAVLQQGLAPTLIHRDVDVLGVIRGIPEVRDHGLRFEFEVSALHYRGRSYPTPGRVRLNWYHPPAQLKAGSRWRLTVRMKPPSGFRNPGGRDYEAWLFQHHIRATGYVRHRGRHEALGLDKGLSARLDRWRQNLSQRLSTLAEAGPTRALLVALAVGERSAVSPHQWTVLRATGTNHLLAISGLHIGLIAVLALWMGRLLWSLSYRAIHWMPAQQAGAVFAAVAATAYAALAGFSIPTQRAWIMVLVVVLAMLWRRRVRPGHSLAVALILVLFWDPLSVLAPGFWLSFAAVAMLLLPASGSHRGLWSRWGRAQMLVFLGLGPLLLFWFQQFSLLSPLVNILAIPWLSLLVIPPLFLAMLCLPLSASLAQPLLHLSQWSLAAMWWGLERVAALNWHWYQAAPPWWAVGMAMLGMLWVCLPRGVPLRHLGLLWLLPALLAGARPPDIGEADVVLLDVGQGLSAVVRTHAHTLVFDTGPAYGPSFDTGNAVVLPYLRQLGVNGIDRMIISHPDNDHIGGAKSILAAMPVRSLLSSTPGRLPAARSCRAGQSWQWEGVDFIMLHPPADYRGERHSENNLSCVLKVRTRGGAVLLTGDIERPAEHYLVTHRYRQLAASVLVAPHHGSKSSSSEAFIRAVSPRFVLYPVGYYNRYGFPNARVRARYARLGIGQLDTASDGAILVHLGGRDSGPPLAYRRLSRRYWQRQGVAR